MIARLDEIGKDLKEVKRENASLLKALLEANSNAEKVVLEYKLRDKEYRKLEQIAKLYGMEDTYRREKFTADEIYRRRNSKETTEIINKIRTELYDLLANPDENRSELMGKALNYLKNFWNQIFAYRNDGEYSIDNMAAERAIRPITVQRKNSLFFGSVKGIQNSAIYNTFIETCKQAGSLLQGLLLQTAQRIKKGKNGLRKPSSHDNMQIIIVKFVNSFLDGCLQAPV